jgi:glycine/serine hydroxymethyltransferase
MTTAGMAEPEMAEVAGLIGRTLRARGDESSRRAVADEVKVLCAKFPPYPGAAH